MCESITVKAVSEILNLRKEAVYGLCRRGELGGAEKDRGRWRVDKQKFLVWAATDGGKATLAAERKLRPFFGYFGGKWRDAVKNYPKPRHDTIVEPFAGSAGYSLRYHWKRVILCEADPILVAIWRYLIEVEPAEIRAIPDVPLGGSVDDLDLPDAARWLVGFWVNRATTSPRKRPSSWMRDGIRPGSFWGERVRETIASQVDAIRHWEVHDGGYETCPTPEDATWFIDPPYEKAGRAYRFGSSGIDFGALATWCRTRPGQVVVCENAGAEWLPFRRLADVKTTRAGTRSKEWVWSNTAIPPEDAGEGDG